MNKKTLCILFAVLTLAGIAAMGFCAYQMMASVFLQNYLRLACFIALGIASMTVTAFSMIRFLRNRKNAADT